MHKLATCVRFALLMFLLFGCANTETESGRRSTAGSKWINGVNYASDEVNEQNVFGQQGNGLSSNPQVKPTSSQLGPYNTQFGDVTIHVGEESREGFINEIIDFEVILTAESGGPAKNARVVVMLDKSQAASSNGSLVWTADSAQELLEARSDMIIAETSSLGRLRFRMHTGTAYHNNNPMYYVNVWSANAKDPGSIAVYVFRPPSVTDEGVVKGNGDTVNDTSIPASIRDEYNASALESATLTPTDSLNQQLFVKYKKKLGVRLTGSATASGNQVVVPGEKACWTFVGYDADRGGVNDATIDGSDPRAGCKESDANGIVWVELYTGKAYGAKYYLNFFHSKADAPVVYEITTFAMPETLGVEGSGPGADFTGEGKPTETLKVDFPEPVVDPDSGAFIIEGKDARDLLETIAGDDPRLDAILEAHCYNSKGAFVCSLVEDPHGNWMLVGEDGAPIYADIDGDGLDEQVILVFETDGDGNTYFVGYDTDGDGKADVAPDPCMIDPTGVGCSKGPAATVVLQCRASATDDWAENCGVRKTPIDNLVPLEVRAVQLSGAAKSGEVLTWSIVRGADASNNAAFSSKTGPVTLKQNTSGDGISTASFWSGTGYSSTYYIRVESASAKTLMMPISVIYSMSLPLSEGDKPSADALKPGGEAMKAPDGMPPADPALGDVVIVASGAKTISAPVVKTLLLGVKAVKAGTVGEAEPVVVKSTKFYWKVTRGAALSNNATIIANITNTDVAGESVNQFYTGTAYNSLYYVSVFHPNAKDPLVYAITVENYSGGASGPTGKPSVPEGETIGEDGKPCSGAACGGNLGMVNGESTYPQYPQGGGCGKIDEACLKDDADPAKCPNIAIGSGDKQGCLELQIVGETNRFVEINARHQVKVRLVWRNGSEVTPVNGDIVWTLDKGADADGSIVSKYSAIDKQGYSTMTFVTGTKANTKYRLNAMFPNIHKDGSMVPHSVTITTTYGTLTDSGEADKNTIRATSHASGGLEEEQKRSGESIGAVYYCLASSRYYACDPAFALRSKAALETHCLSMASGDNRPQWKGGKMGEETTMTVADVRDSFIVFAVGYASATSDTPLGYGCAEMLKFPAVPKSEETIEERFLDVDIELNAIPMEVFGAYQTKTLYDLGGVLVEGTSLGDKITGLANMYVDIFGPDDNPGKQLVDYIKKYVGFDPAKALEAVECTKAFCNGEERPFALVCPAKAEDGDKPEDSRNRGYKECTCICGKFYYYLQVDSIGAMLFPMLMKLLENGVNSAIGKATGGMGLQAKMCEVFDSIQFIEFEGTTTFNPSNVSGKQDRLVGQVRYSGIRVPALQNAGVNPKFSAVVAKWQDAGLSNGIDQLSVSNLSFNLSYGLLIYELLASMMPGSENGKVNLLGFLDCKKLFGFDISLPVIGSLKADALQTLCTGFLGQANSKIFDFAEEQYMALGITANGRAEFARGGDTCDRASTGAGCKAQEVKRGLWEGKGTISGKSYNIDGLWAAHRASLDRVPAYVYGDKTVAEFKAERSVCQRKLQEASEARKMTDQMKAEGKVTNQNCLMGSFDKPEGRATNNYCAQDVCKGMSIVVCSGGQFNSAYAKATGPEIIKAANQHCAKNAGAGVNDCATNPEIINGGKGITNKECIEKSCIEACIDNPSILVCEAKGKVLGSGNDDKGVAAMNEVCGAGYVSSEDGSLIVGASCSGAKTACASQCGVAGCLMNSEAGCGDPEAPAVPSIRAVWNIFDDNGAGPCTGKNAGQFVCEDGKVKNAEFGTALIAGMRPDKGTIKASSDPGYKLFFDPNNKARLGKLVAGTDATLGAAGVEVLSGEKWILSIPAETGCSSRRVSMRILGDGRKVKIANGSTTYHDAVIDQWTLVALNLGSASGLVSLEITTSTNDSSGFKMMRLDEIKVEAVCAP